MLWLLRNASFSFKTTVSYNFTIHVDESIFQFLDETKTSSNGGIQSLDNDKCGAQWKLPADCDINNNTCDYVASWEYLGQKRGKDSIRFTITTKQTKTWTGIGFSNDKKMVCFFLLITILHV